MNLPISIKGARQHNLKSVDLDLPREAIIALCGPSGSGKSSLAIDTLYAESRRRFLDCLSPQARQHLAQPDKPDADSITGLPPALCLEQSASAYGPRALLGSLTEILDYLRVLYAAIGIPHDPDSGTELVRQTSDQVIDTLLSMPEGTRLTLLAPIPAALWADDSAATLGDFQRQGFLRLMWNGEITDIEDLLVADQAGSPDHASLVIDRIVLKGESSASRLSDSLQIALRVNADEVNALVQKPGDEEAELLPFHFRYINPDTGFILPQLTPKHFSFNSPLGYCPECEGLGTVADSKHRHPACPLCCGARLNKAALAVTLDVGSQSLNIAELTSLSVESIIPLVPQISVPPELAQACGPVLGETSKRLTCLERLGLGYLSLDRQVSSLSGGEIQRARLASQLGGGLSGVLYILDEPTTGLHPSDIDRLALALDDLKQLGNTVLVVEHDKQILQQADHLVDMGPGSGYEGGFILAEGTAEQLMDNPQSLTGPWLSGKRSMPLPATPHDSREHLVLKGATAHNLKNVDLSIPLGAFTCVAGPSGSGKSSLIEDCLVPALKSGKNTKGEYWQGLTGANHLSRFVLIDQSPIGKSPRSTPATATGLLNILRPLYAQLPLSKQRGYNAARFSTNTRGGRCERCLGMGFIQVDMHFLGNVSVPCSVCHGKRYNRETLEVTWRGKSIADVLAMSVSEALGFFDAIPRIKTTLSCMDQLGLGYLTLDRPADSLSGGESQRIKIASELSKIPPRSKGHDRFTLPPALFILDEPTTGLHFQEVAMLLSALFSLREAGHTILCIEHNLDMLAAADHLIDMGPGAGNKGGNIVYQGHPENIPLESPTGKWLREAFMN